MHGDGAFSIGALTALAGGAGLCDDPSRSLALAAGTADAEEALLEPHLAGPFTAGAGLDRGGTFGAASLTVRADFPTGDFKFGLFPVDGFFEGQFQIVLEVVAALRSIAASLAAEEILEDIVEGVAESASAKSFRAAALLRAGMAEHVITLAFFLIAQRLVCLVDFFELLFRSFLLCFSRLEIRVMLPGHLAIGLLEFVFGGGSFDA